MKTKLLLVACLALLGLMLGGCVSTNLNANVSDNADISSLDSFYVAKLEADERGIEERIAEALRERGFQATSGTADQVPAGVDAVVRYEDRWMWDITMYMLEIKIEFRDPETEVLLATGTSYRTSMARKDPDFMINEVLTEIFNQ